MNIAIWRPQGDSNPRYRRERAMSWASRRWGPLDYFLFGVPRGIRTPVTAVKGRCPRPLDDGDLELLLNTNNCVLGGARRDRTADLLHAMQALSQLSYNPLKNEIGVYKNALLPVK